MNWWFWFSDIKPSSIMLYILLCIDGPGWELVLFFISDTAYLGWNFAFLLRLDLTHCVWCRVRFLNIAASQCCRWTSFCFVGCLVWGPRVPRSRARSLSLQKEKSSCWTLGQCQQVPESLLWGMIWLNCSLRLQSALAKERRLPSAAELRSIGVSLAGARFKLVSLWTSHRARCEWRV